MDTDTVTHTLSRYRIIHTFSVWIQHDTHRNAINNAAFRHTLTDTHTQTDAHEVCDYNGHLCLQPPHVAWQPTLTHSHRTHIPRWYGRSFFCCLYNCIDMARERVCVRVFVCVCVCICVCVAVDRGTRLTLLFDICSHHRSARLSFSFSSSSVGLSPLHTLSIFPLFLSYTLK